MAIKISNLQQIANQYAQKAYYYKDLHLDFEKAANFQHLSTKKLKGMTLKLILMSLLSEIH